MVSRKMCGTIKGINEPGRVGIFACISICLQTNDADSLISMAASIHCIVVNLHPAPLLLGGAWVLYLRL